MLNWISANKFLSRSFVLTVALGASIAVATAQTPALDTSTQPSSVPVVSTSSAQLYSSSADENAPEPVTEASLLPPVNFANLMQYGGGQRSRYGRPRYRGNNTNEDGSNKYTFYGGVGLQQPIGNTWHYYTPSYAFQVGFGRQFNKKFAVPIEFDWDNAGLTGQTLGNQLTLYNNDTNFYCNENATNQLFCAENNVSDLTSLDGNAHVWSFSIDPTYTFFQAEKVGAYAVAGAGFYHKVTNFTTPEVEEECYYYCEEYEANAVIDHYTSNAPGFSAGFGLTYKFSRFSNERFYVEAKYVFVDNSHRAGVNVNSPVNATTIAVANDFSPNSNHTTYFPIKAGIRF